MTAVEPTAEHAWLNQMVGNWEFVSESLVSGEWVAGGGTESVRSLGGAWVLMEGKGTAPDGATHSYQMTLGFDPDRGRHVGTWIGSMMHSLWVYEGRREGDSLVLEVDGPSWEEEGAVTRYRDVVTQTPEGRTLESLVQRPDGEWLKFMTATFRRV